MRPAAALLVLAGLVLAGIAACQPEVPDTSEKVPDTARAAAAERKAKALERAAAVDGETGPPGRAERLAKPDAQAVDPQGREALDDAITCLARTIYWEARGEEAASMEAVASVVMNRLGHAGYSDTVCGVVKDGNETGACQFSWWCDGRPDQAREDAAYATAKEVARKALNRELRDRTRGALYFHHRAVSPAWSATYARTAEIGDFVFYKPRDGEAR